uniref:F-box and FNIp repeat-containing protein n=1 Tax=Borely moumouvirus TaxID=2712067 RepID=A0A6G6ACR3_9VIRU
MQTDIYFKIIGSDWKNRDKKYNLGLNVIDHFEENGSCVPGRMYFCDPRDKSQNICRYLHYGDILAIITLPVYDPDFKMLVDPSGGKTCANKIIIQDFKYLEDVETFKYLESHGVDIKKNYVLKWACDRNYYDIVIYLMSITPKTESRQSIISKILEDENFVDKPMRKYAFDLLRYRNVICSKESHYNCLPQKKLKHKEIYPNNTSLVIKDPSDFYHLSESKTITHLFISTNISFDLSIIPHGITHVMFGSNFNQPLKGKMPNSVTYLRFGWDFNQSIHGFIPESVTHLIFQDSFNQSIEGCIPTNVTHLTFGHDFNQPIKGCIPNSVTHLTFGTSFNQSIMGAIPNNVTHLTFGSSFNQPIQDCIPNSVTHLTFGWAFNQPIKGCIPNSVTLLKFGNHFNQSILGCIPASVTLLEFGEQFNQSISGCIPDSVTFLKFGECFNQSIIGSIPDSVTYLEFGQEFNQSIEGCIPDSVTHLTFGSKFCQSIAGHIPDSVIHLVFK